MNKYNPQKIESKWQKFWETKKVFQASDKSKKPKKFILVEFPYPSGAGLHMGHLRPYVAADVYSRYYRMKGFETLFPIGWDAFGLPAENYAIKMGVHPSITTKQNVANAKKQMQSWGLSFDWAREINTTDPEYYKWTQWLFLQFYKKGLAYEATGLINWCPKDKTGLANEEVIDGKCERCGTVVEKKELRQWYLKITEYAEKLLEGLKTLEKWPEAVKLQQENWIGKKTGLNISFGVENKEEQVIEVFTTSPETIFGVTFIVIGPEHFLLKEQGLLNIDNKYFKEVLAYQKKALKTPEEERLKEGRKKTGVFTGVFVINKLNNSKIPVYVSDYVLGNVGTGAVMGVPGHDKRDFEFANIFKLSIIRVIQKDANDVGHIDNIEKVQDEEGIMTSSEFLDGLKVQEASEKIMDFIEAQGYGRRVINYKLRDWVFSRQRYWGEPIPLIHCEDCGVVPVSDKDLPVKLPNVKKYEPTGTGESPLADIKNWLKTKCPKCGKLAWRETNTMPQWAGSSWYWLRYTDPKNKKKFSDLKKQKYWTPVDVYFGGMEHTTLHLLYSRFWNLFLYDQGLVTEKEPYILRKPHGIVLGPDGEKMSKSRGNVVDPQGVVKQYGADVLRMYEMFLGPHEAMVSWNDKGIVGVARFLDRVWNWVSEIVEAPHQKIRNPKSEIRKNSKSKEEQTINKFLLLHGKGGSPSSGVLPWLKKELESKGFKVEVPTLPNPEAPNDAEQTEYVLKNCKIDESTAVLGHSFGGVVALRLLEKGAKAGQVVLAATPFSGKFLDNKERPTVSEALKKGFDFKTISKNCKNFVALYDTSDDVVPMSDGQSFADQLKTQLVKVKSEKSHFAGENEPNLILSLAIGNKTEVKDTEKVERELNKLIKKITQDIENFSFNTCISAFMEFHNAVKDDFITLESIKKFLAVLYPFAPHISEELNQQISKLTSKQVSKTLQAEIWPGFDESLIAETQTDIVVQINGKVRGKIKVATNLNEAQVQAEALKLEPVKQALIGETIKRTIYVKDRLINLVI